MSVNIAIDGPSGAGKSTLSDRLAAELGFLHLDTGALYRTVAVYFLKKKIPVSDKKAVLAALPDIRVTLSYVNQKQHVFLNGEDVTDRIRTQEVSMAASAVSAVPEVRAFLLALQRDLAEKHDVIMDGRDIGTVILPNAQVKFFVTVSPEVRARRRFEELKAKGLEQDGAYERILAEIIKRDRDDSSRAACPLKPAADAVFLDNSYDFEATVSEALQIIRSRI